MLSSDAFSDPLVCMGQEPSPQRARPNAHNADVRCERSLKSDPTLAAGNNRITGLRLTRGGFYVLVLVRFIEWNSAAGKKFEAFSGAHAYYIRRRGARSALQDVIALVKVSMTVRLNHRSSVVAEKKKENVEHPVGASCQRTGYSLRRLSNIVS